MREVPVIKHPEVRNASEVPKLEMQEAQTAEQVYYDWKVKHEEMFSIFDETKQHLSNEELSTYMPPQVEGSDFETEEDARAFQAEMGVLVSLQEAVRSRKGRDILFADFKVLQQQCPTILVDVLHGAILKEELKKMEQTDEDGLVAGDKERATQVRTDLQEKAELKTIGKLTGLEYQLSLRFDPLLRETEAISEDELLLIKAYQQANRGDVKQAIRNIRAMKEGIGAGKAARSGDVVIRPAAVAKKYGSDTAQVNASAKRLELVTRKRLKRDFKFGVEQTYDETQNFVDHDLVSAYVNYHREMEVLYRALNKGEIVETAYVKEIIERAMPALKKNPPTIVYFTGDYGTGKTALARHIARYHVGKEPIVVAGSKHTDPDAFLDRFQIRKLSSRESLNLIRQEMGIEKEISGDLPIGDIISEIIGDKKTLREQVTDKVLRDQYNRELLLKTGEWFDEKKYQKYAKEQKDKLSKEVVDDIEEQVDTLFGNPVQGRYVLGYMYQAMMEGRPLILDEANALSPEVLISFNDLLTRKIGERIATKADIKNFKIRSGYCVMWTGNIGERFDKRARASYELDAAAFSRVIPIQMRYLPQQDAVANMTGLLERLESDKLSEKAFSGDTEMLEFVKRSKGQAKADQIFQVLLVKLLNDRLGAELLVKDGDRSSTFKDLYRLSMGARLIMNLFEGKVGADHFPSLPNMDRLVGDGTGQSLASELKKANLTMRELLDQVVGEYRDYGMSMDLEYYLWKYVKRYDQYPKEQAIIYAVLTKAGFFPETQGWPDYKRCTDIKEFSAAMDFDPVTGKAGKRVEKYKKIQQNGESISLLNVEGGGYHLEYFSSVEMLQLLFGYLPARRQAEYKSIGEVIRKEKRSAKAHEDLSPEEVARYKDMFVTMGEIIDGMNGSYWKTAAEVTEFRNMLRSFRLRELSEKMKTDPMAAEELVEEIDKFYNTLIDLHERMGKIDAKTAAKAKALGTREKGRFLSGLMSGKK
ncbi:hypothetical protein EPO05_01760 [Patescibacteria group bacterium]|nr:MAG: hypothetical protein EPO05_01760 [Patescibacteria group bacterium]